MSVPVVGFVPFASGLAQRALATSFRINASVKSAPEMSPTFDGFPSRDDRKHYSRRQAVAKGNRAGEKYTYHPWDGPYW